jgi:thioredoxin-related protein
VLRRPIYFIATLAVLIAAAGAHVRAALDAHAPTTGGGLEFLVLEVKGCHVCELVRTHILPQYERSTTARDAPMRFVDLNAVDEAKLGLTAPVTTVPTVVLMREGQEVARLTGYMGPQIFFQAVPEMLARAE